MFTVCIPVYNSDPGRLVRALWEQAGQLPAGIEILVLNDASAASWQPAFDAIATEATVVNLPANHGRAKIRNAFVQRAASPYLLYLDGDVQVPGDFLGRWYAWLQGHPEAAVCCGGKEAGLQPAGSGALRWKYAKKREALPAALRSLNPHQSFITGNFMIQKSCLQQHPFNENLTGYGHEDTLFGFSLMQNKIPVYHIDNPIIIGEYESAPEFISKTKEAIHNLFNALELCNYHPDFVNSIKLLRAHQKLLNSPFYPFFRCSGNLIAKFAERLLLLGIHSLFLLDIFKLFYFNRNACGIVK